MALIDSFRTEQTRHGGLQSGKAAKSLAGHATLEPALRELSVSVVGLGYVGVVSVGCLSDRGFRVVGVDVLAEKIKAVATGKSPIVEAGLDALLSEGVKSGRVRATHDLAKAVLETDISILAVGTPTSPDGGCDLTYVTQASRTIGTALALKPGYHLVILRCSVPPGTTADVVIPTIELASGKRVGADFGVCFAPEFLREGQAVADFRDPPKIVIAASDERAGKLARQVLAFGDQPVLTTSLLAAETVKYVDNVWHATKVVFANEVGRLCKSMDLDSHEVMRLFVQDTKLNISPYYLKPGFAFGGSCLPKEVRAVSHMATVRGLSLPLMESLIRSNRDQVDEALRLLAPFEGRKFGVLGLTFKPATDDLRESPMLDLLAALLEKREAVRAFDANLTVRGDMRTRQIAAACRAKPNLASQAEAIDTALGPALADVMTWADVVVVAHATDAFRQAVRQRRPDVYVVDLARLFPDLPKDAFYQGIAW
jgi:GDP-mannose 6-dehydrogenase